MNKYTRFSYEEIIVRLKQIENKKNERQLALSMGLRPDTLAQMKIRKKIPFETIIAYCEKTGYSLDKLFFNISYNDIVNSNLNSVNTHENNIQYHNYKVYGTNDYMRLPTVNNSSAYKIITYLNTMYMIDDTVKSYTKAGYYVVRIGAKDEPIEKSLVVVKILTKLDGGLAYNYVGSSLVNDVTLDELSKLTMIGAVKHSISLETLQ